MNNNVAALSINSAVSAIVAKLLAPAPAVDILPTPTSGVGIILNPLFQLINRAAPMDINLNQLLNSAVLQSTLQQLPAELLARPQVIEAMVLRNTLLPSANANATTAPSNPLLITADVTTLESASNYRITMQWQNRILQFLSPQPLPTGKPVQLQINARGEVLLLPPATLTKIATSLTTPSTASPNNTPSAATNNTLRTATNTATQTATTAATKNVAATIATTITTNQEATLNPTIAKIQAPLQTLQQSLREMLPRQEPLHTLVPLLRQLLMPAAAAQLPPVIGKMLQQFLQSLPKPAQLQSGEGVKRALENSGSFLEARIAKANSIDTQNNEPLTKVLTTDLKAQLTALLNSVRQLATNTPSSNTPTSNTPTKAHAARTLVNAANQDDELVYNPKQFLRGQHNSTLRNADATQTDTELLQLGKLLEAGLARIQLNQLDSAVSRHSNSETTMPIPAWVLELPLSTARGTDNLQVRIEQHRKQHDARTRVQWTVQIAFDLHELGKLAATLSIVEKNVAATLWAEHANTHRTVQEKIDYLRAGLESVGVKVTEMQCRLGLPPARAALVSQQLVDVHT